jgi:hypothetical protein
MTMEEVAMRLWNRGRRTVRPNPLIQVVTELGPGTRRAILAAASEGVLRRWTWNGCPLNRAGAQLGQEVCTPQEAARVFGLSRTAVDQFLGIWDSLVLSDDDSCTALLVAAIEELDGPVVASEFMIRSTEAPAPTGDRQVNVTLGAELSSGVSSSGVCT